MFQKILVSESGSQGVSLAAKYHITIIILNLAARGVSGQLGN